jgi:AcrR family transcriptional regulator
METAKKITRPRGRPSRKAEIVAATEALLREKGLVGVTTRAIAESVPCSEGAIYVHFEDRLALILAVLEESLPEMLTPLHELTHKVGAGRLEDNLVKAVEGLVRFHQKVLRMLCGVIGEPELLMRFRESLGERGPERGITTLARYLEEEKKLGRVGAVVDTKTVARALMASSFFHVFTGELFGGSHRLEIKELVATAIGEPSSVSGI